jgi:general secretion pathway protein K
MAVSARHLRPRAPLRQGGLALVTAVLVVAMAAVAATAMVVSQQRSQHRTGGLLHGIQVDAYAVGAESWARVLLRRAGQDNPYDALDQDWAQPLPLMPVEGGSLQGQIRDEQGRFNLNNLFTGAEVNAAALLQFQRLLLLLELDEQLANALLDWLDPDINARFPEGAEDDHYLGLDPPYRAANAPLAHVSELRLVAGYDREVVERLLPYVAALPEATPLNVNTAPAILLATLVDGMSLVEAEGMVQTRDEEPFQTLEQFTAQTAFAGRELLEVPLGLRSQYFRLQGQVMVGTSEVWLSSLLQRGADYQVRLVSRNRILPLM